MENKEPDTRFPELVAYLDGELAPEEKTEVETRLADDPEYRRELAQLQKTWDLLDILPSVEATEAFTQSTVEMVAVSAATQVYSTSNWSWARRYLAIILLAIIPVAGFCYGFWRTNTNLNADNESTIKDLTIIQRFPVYRSVNADVAPDKSIEFLELLADANQTGDVFISFDQNQSLSVQKDQFDHKIQPANLKDSSIDQVNLEKLSENKKRFDNLGSQKANLQKFHQSLENHPKRDRLIEALASYHVWFRGRVFMSSQQEVDMIKDASPVKRLEMIRSLEMEYFHNSFKYMQKGSRIPAIQDFKKIKSFGREILGSIRDDFIQWLATANIADNPELDSIVTALKAAPSDHHFFSLLIRFRSQIYGEEFVNPFFDSGRIRPFIDELSEESQKILEGLDNQTKFIVVQLWIISTLGNIDNSELAQFEDKALTGVQRNSLNKLNSYQKKREILAKAFFYTLEPFGLTSANRKLPDDLLQLAEWKPFPENRQQ